MFKPTLGIETYDFQAAFEFFGTDPGCENISFMMVRIIERSLNVTLKMLNLQKQMLKQSFQQSFSFLCT